MTDPAAGDAPGPVLEPEPKPKWRRILNLVLHVLLHVFFILFFIGATYAFIAYDKSSDACIEPKESEETTETTAATVAQENAEGAGEEAVANANAVTEATVTTTEAPKKKKFVPFILCTINWCHGYGLLIVMLVIFYIFWLYYWVFKPYAGRKLYNNYIEGWIDKWIEFSRKMIVSGIMLAIVIVLAVGYLLFECSDNFMKATGLLGPVAFILLGVAVSKHKKRIPWRIVTHGLLGQLILAIVCLRLKFGRDVFQCAGQKVIKFLGFAQYGARFVYGDRICDEFVFAFAILAVVFFFSVTTSILYFLGWMQFFLSAFGFLLQATVGTTICESINAVGNVFLGMSESPLLIRPYLPILTSSELHSICTSGYATVSGSVLSAYVCFGANPAYLITASVMAAPGGLAFSKLFYPEIEESQTRADNIKLEKSEDRSILDAAANGAATALGIVLGIVANIIAFLAIVHFLNAVVQWCFEMLGQREVSLLFILSLLFWPVAFVMGVPIADCAQIGWVVAEKTLINEFVAYKHLGQMITDKSIDPRSASIATFALCGFANPGSMGVLIASLSAMAPNRRPDITRVAFRAFFAGSLVSFTSASLAGILIKTIESDVRCGYDDA